MCREGLEIKKMLFTRQLCAGVNIKTEVRLATSSENKDCIIIIITIITITMSVFLVLLLINLLLLLQLVSHLCVVSVI